MTLNSKSSTENPITSAQTPETKAEQNTSSSGERSLDEILTSMGFVKNSNLDAAILTFGKNKD